MTDDPFESELEALFETAPAFDDAEAFAQAVERRLAPEPEPTRASPLRWGVVGLAALVGGGLSLQSLQAAAASSASAFDQAQATLAGWSTALVSALADFSVGAAGSELWMLAGVGAVIAAGLVVLQEV